MTEALLFGTNSNGGGNGGGELDFISAGSTSNPQSLIATAFPQEPALEFGDPMVVNARHVPSGLPRSVAAKIPDTPAGNRVRKGFDAITDHDWNVAHAWFQDALSHDPGNAGIQRLIDFAEYTLEREHAPHPRTPSPVADTSARAKARMATLGHVEDDQMNADLAKVLDDFNRNYLPKYSALPEPTISSLGAKKIKASWTAFFDSIFKKERKMQ